MRYVPDEGAGEVQTPLYDPTGQLRIGDPVFFRHAKAGELCERFDRLLVVQGGRVLEERMSTYRGDGQCFL
jgi:D-serine deaminase-like pyridoxal phosphate-dependent protein